MGRTQMAGWGLAAIATALVVALLGVDVLRARPAGAAAGNQLVVARSGYNSNSHKGAVAYCPIGKRVLGGGGRVADGDGYVALTELTPITGGVVDGFQAVANEVPGGYVGLWDVHAYAICGDLVSGLQRVSASGDAPANATAHQVTVECPSGKKVIGLGGAVTGTGNTFQWIRPYDHGSHGSVVVSGVHDATTTREPEFRVTAYAICGNPPPGYEIQAVGTLAYTGRYLQTSIRCTNSKFAFGAGLTKSDPQGVSHVDEMFPGEAPHGGSQPAPTGGAGGAAGGRGPFVVWTGSRQPGTANPIHLGAWAICAD